MQIPICISFITDLILLEFSKAFDKVSHEKLALKLHDYGIRGSALKWVKVFLDNHHQSGIVNGSSSKPIPVSSRVSQGSVLGPLLFLIYINDLPMNVESKVRLFADDTALYLTISTSSLLEILQKDLDNLECWSHKWDMDFNHSKCQVIHITRSKTPFPTQYTLYFFFTSQSGEWVSLFKNTRDFVMRAHCSDHVIGKFRYKHNGRVLKYLQTHKLYY